MTLIKSISGIRGTIGGNTGDNLTPIDAVKFAAAYGTWLKEYSKKENLKIVTTPIKIVSAYLERASKKEGLHNGVMRILKLFFYKLNSLRHRGW